MSDAEPRNLIVPHGFEADYTTGFLRGLAANGVPIRVVSSDTTAERLDRLGIPHSNLRGSQDPRRSARTKAWNLLRYYVRLLALVGRCRGATIHFTGLARNRIVLIDALILATWLRLWAGRYVYTAHNVLPHGREASAFFRFAYRWIYRLPDTIVVHTAGAARRLQDEFGVEPERLRVVSIGLNEEVPNTALTAAQARQRIGVGGDQRLALFFGSLRPYKGVDVLLQAWQHVRTPGARLVIAGHCPDAAYAGRIRQLIASSPRRTVIEWREGFVAREAVEVWFKAADVVVLPHRAVEQSGVTFLCLRFGVPIVASDVGSMAEFVGEPTGVLAPSNHPPGIAEAIDRVFADPSRFRREEILRVAEQYRWENACRPLVPLYRMPAGKLPAAGDSW
jgi:glycosyltransferase involved in cell wall biosynthesis